MWPTDLRWPGAFDPVDVGEVGDVTSSSRSTRRRDNGTYDDCLGAELTMSVNDCVLAVREE